MDFNQARRRYELQKAKRSNVEAIWDIIQKYVLPFRALFFTDRPDENQMNWRRREIYDSTAVDAAQALAATINSNLTNPVLRWFEISVKGKALNSVNSVRIWLEMVSERIFQVLQATNFNLAASELYLDMVGFGTASIIEEIREAKNGALDKILFNTIPVDQCFFDEDDEGKAINFYRILDWTPLQIVSKFGKENTPAYIVDMLDDVVLSSTKMRILFVVFKRFNIEAEGDGRPVAPEQRPYGSKYFLLEKARKVGEEQIGPTQGYYEMPVYLPRWRKVSGSQWGYSPAMVVLSTILSLNQLIEIIFAANEKFVDPPILSTRRGVLSDYDLRAGKITIAQDIGAVKQWEFKGRLDYGFMQKEDMTRQIREAFFVDQLQLKESPAMTATEVNVRYQLMQKLVGPTVGQIQYDFLGPLIRRTFQILYRYRMLPPPPRELLESGATLDIEYLGPMAKAQRQDTMVAIERWMMGVLQMAQAFPTAMDIPDVDQTVTELGYSAGVPASIIRNKATIMAERLKREQEIAQAKELAMAEQAGKAAQAAGAGKEALSGSVRESAKAA